MHDVRNFLFPHFSIFVRKFPSSLFSTRFCVKNMSTAVVAIVPLGTFREYYMVWVI